MSQARKMPPSCAAISAPADFARSMIATVAPAAASSSALARPRPLAPPTTMAFLPAISISACLAHVDPDALHLGVGVERIDPHLASDAARFHPPERKHVRTHPIGVDPDDPGTEPLDHSVGAAEIAGPDARGEPISRVVGDLDRLGL